MNAKAKAAIGFVAIFLFFYVGFWKWTVCRVYVEPGEILVISNKFGDENPHPDRDRVVADNVKGVWKEVRGEGRHFYSPVQYHADTASTQRYTHLAPHAVQEAARMVGEALWEALGGS